MSNCFVLETISQLSLESAGGKTLYESLQVKTQDSQVSINGHAYAC